MKITSASNPVYSKSDNSQITCMIDCDIGVIPFTASANDSMPYGISIFHDLVSGKYGAIAPYAGSSFEAADIALSAQIPVLDLATQLAALTQQRLAALEAAVLNNDKTQLKDVAAQAAALTAKTAHAGPGSPAGGPSISKAGAVK